MIRALRTRLAAEDGISMVVVMSVLMMTTLLVVSAFAVANGDIKVARDDQDDKQAYAAAEAGIQYYFFHLAEDNAYWTNCTTVPPPSASEPSPIVQPWSGSGTDTRTGHWRNVSGGSGQYAIELLATNGYSTCDTNNPEASMLTAGQGTFRIRSTGISRAQKRSIIATFKRRSFLDYLYFTDFETSDPVTYGDPTWISWASTNCNKYKRQSRSSWCTPIQFADQDQINGPFHTNDEILVCGTPTFGRTGTDSIEVSGGNPPSNPGWTQNGGCSGTPDFVGTFAAQTPTLQMPPSNTSLKTIAVAPYKFTGTTTIVLNGTQMTVSNPAWSGTQNFSLPSNGVIYVSSGSCGTSGYSIFQDYTTPSGCGDVWVKGNYSGNLTIAADNDIVINGDLTHNADAELGLISNNFVRVYHPVNRNATDPYTCTNATGTMSNVQIDAAILSLNHSFIVDNYYCGNALSNLTVNGAIAQRFRGPVGTGSGGAVNTGYTKRYNYDDRLKFREPPYFLDPVQAQWRISRETEQVPPR